jgi:hypothetical protein
MKNIAITCALSALLGCHAAAAVVPEQIRLALTGNPTEMLVFWATSNVSTPQTYAPTVWFGTSPATLATVGGTTSNYSAYRIASPFLHHGAATGLTENTFYYYRVSADDPCGKCIQAPIDANACKLCRWEMPTTESVHCSTSQLRQRWVPYPRTPSSFLRTRTWGLSTPSPLQT